ncbi:MGH1-like glycoside hydrolase domain-containing protein [Bianquea renquensis]|uniref:Mannosylglycerate hydrolase MGH1-like glycoside hydrolase domain-containing protein n=1 Tax=Bianquea renquensis TaxID=2763661 RepID=A0A926DTN1_9FIRM|nr:hypothetical protein [Bianquea renquensis]MBC8543532.1 hypothetical protein [Bianquea renquensis]
MKVEVTFQTADRALQKLYNAAEEKEKHNIRYFGDRKVLVEGGGYNNIWLETQPMGGGMYAKRDMEAALNNQLLFMEYQKENGRIPGMIVNRDGVLDPKYDWFQGFCFPDPAFSLYFWNGENRDYLLKLYHTLKAIDEYWWTYRDSDHDGCLETWCICDTGEDNCTRFFDAPGFWGGEEPPTGVAKLPYESMDYMAYSYEARKTLAAISAILDNGEEADWEQKAEAVRKKLREYLWIEDKNACYDRDCQNEFMDILLHNNIRVMHHGAFDQEMADRFIAHHMLNPKEFWTPMPLPSIAVNDAFFRNNEDNDWSGQPEGLTYQRAIRAMENYGHYAELTMIGKKLMEAAGEEGLFTQQYDPFTGRPSTPHKNDYGPTILAILEYIERFYGVHVDKTELYWGCLPGGGQSRVYRQQWGEHLYAMVHEGEWNTAYLDGEELFSVSDGVRVVTDREGRIGRIAGIDVEAHKVTVRTAQGATASAVIGPNEVFAWRDGSLCLEAKIPFAADEALLKEWRKPLPRQ